ncbi:alpha-protein kinase 3 isoform X2 [Melanerpes formicivorus]|uniref:alpha-protein kinase 3 isoform X2 n=1 Tax=Melanerpes formicivorus TaxID=211600 RepID=UPI00358FAF1D
MGSSRRALAGLYGQAPGTVEGAEEAESAAWASRPDRRSYLLGIRPQNRSTFCAIISQLTEETQPLFESTIQSRAVSEHADAKFTCVVTGFPAPEVTWYKDDQEMDRYCGLPKYQIFRHGNRHTLQLYKCREEDAGIYQASARNPKGIVSCSGVLEVGTMTEFKIHQRWFDKIKRKAEEKLREIEQGKKRGKENVEVERLQGMSPDRLQRKRRLARDRSARSGAPAWEEEDAAKVHVADAQPRLQKDIAELQEQPARVRTGFPNKLVAPREAEVTANGDAALESAEESGHGLLKYMYETAEGLAAQPGPKDSAAKKKKKKVEAAAAAKQEAAPREESSRERAQAAPNPRFAPAPAARRSARPRAAGEAQAESSTKATEHRQAVQQSTKAPGTTTPGTTTRGTTALGTMAPGTTAPGTTAPGTTAVGTTTPGTTALGTTAMGTTAPGTTAPGTTAVGTTTPGTTALGTTTPGTTALGTTAMGTTALGTTAPGTTAPGTTAPGITAPGTTAPGTTAPGTTAPGTTTPGTTAMGTTALGTTAPGTTAPGTTGPGTTAPGTTAMGTRAQDTLHFSLKEMFFDKQGKAAGQQQQQQEAASEPVLQPATASGYPEEAAAASERVQAAPVPPQGRRGQHRACQPEANRASSAEASAAVGQPAGDLQHPVSAPVVETSQQASKLEEPRSELPACQDTTGAVRRTNPRLRPREPPKPPAPSADHVLPSKEHPASRKQAEGHSHALEGRETQQALLNQKDKRQGEEEPLPKKPSPPGPGEKTPLEQITPQATVKHGESKEAGAELPRSHPSAEAGGSSAAESSPGAAHGQTAGTPLGRQETERSAPTSVQLAKEESPPAPAAGMATAQEAAAHSAPGMEAPAVQHPAAAQSLPPASREAAVKKADGSAPQKFCGAAPQEEFQGSAPQEKFYGAVPQEKLNGAAPQEKLNGAAPQEKFYGAAPQEFQGSAPQEKFYGAAPQEFQGSAPQEKFYGAAPQEFQGSAPQEKFYGAAPQEKFYGAAPQEEFHGAAPQQKFSDSMQWEDSAKPVPKGPREKEGGEPTATAPCQEPAAPSGSLEGGAEVQPQVPLVLPSPKTPQEMSLEEKMQHKDLVSSLKNYLLLLLKMSDGSKDATKEAPEHGAQEQPGAEEALPPEIGIAGLSPRTSRRVLEKVQNNQLFQTAESLPLTPRTSRRITGMINQELLTSQETLASRPVPPKRRPRPAAEAEGPPQLSVPAIVVGSEPAEGAGQAPQGSSRLGAGSCEEGAAGSAAALPCATPEELASGARRKIFLPRAAGCQEGQAAPQGPGLGGSPAASPAHPAKGTAPAASPPAERRLPAPARKMDTLEVPKLYQQPAGDSSGDQEVSEDAKPEAQPAETKQANNPFKAPQVIRKIRAEQFSDASGNLKLWCQFFNVLSDSKLLWYKDETPVAEAHRSAGDESQVALAVVQASPRDCGAFRCVISNEHGTATTHFLLTPEVLSGLVSREETEAVGEEIEMTPMVFAKGLADAGYWGDKLFGRVVSEDTELPAGPLRKACRARAIYGLEPLFESGCTCIIKVHNFIVFGTKNDNSLVEKNYDITIQECKVQNSSREYCKIFAAEARAAPGFGAVPEILPLYLVYRPANNIPYATMEEDLGAPCQQYCATEKDGSLVALGTSEVVLKCCTFQHWVYQWTNGNILVTDMEGVGWKVTNVRIATSLKGYQGLKESCFPSLLEQFAATHRCNHYCSILGLKTLEPAKPKGSRSPSMGRKSAQSSPQLQKKGLASPQGVRKAALSPKASRRAAETREVAAGSKAGSGEGGRAGPPQ